MRRTSGIAVGGALPWGLIGMLGLILAVERVVVLHDLFLTGRVPLNWRYAKCEAESRAPHCDILCLGSSRVKLGIGARIIGNETGRRTFNLAMNSSSLPANYFVLKRALKAGARPAAVLIDCLDDGTEPFHLHENLRNYPELLDIRETFDIAWHTRDSDFLATILLARGLPSWKTRFEIRRNVLAAFQGRTASLKSDLESERRVTWRNWEANRGTWVILRNPEFEARHRGETVHGLPLTPPCESRATRSLLGTYTKRFLDLAAAHKIRVFYLLPPLPPHTQESWMRFGEDQKRARDAREFQAHYPDLVVIDGRCSDYAIGAFADDVHLNMNGVSTLSVEVASIMKRYLAGPHAERAWVTLPPYRDRGQDPRLENLGQSMVASRPERARRR
jgi:hypothetical protein